MNKGDFYAVDKTGTVYELEELSFDFNTVKVGNPVKPTIPFVEGFKEFFKNSMCWTILVVCDKDEDDNLLLYPTTDYILDGKLEENPTYYEYCF